MNRRNSTPSKGMSCSAWGGLIAASATGSWSDALRRWSDARGRRPYQVTGFPSRLSREIPSWPTQDSSRSADEEADEARLARMRLEAVLLLAKSPLSARKLAQLAHLADATEARTLVRQLNRLYEERGRAIRAEQVAGGYRLLTRPALAPWLTRLGHIPPPIRLSTPMLETLAVVAYRQPVSRASAEAVRGVACGELLRQLMERELVRIVGRSEELGRPYLYGTTKRFLKLFGLPHEDALPPIQWQALQEEPNHEDSPLDDLSTSTKEPVVSITVAPVLNETDPEAIGIVVALASPADSSVTSSFPLAKGDDDEDEFYEEEEDDEEEEEDEDWDEEDDEEWDDDDLEGDEEEEGEEDEAPWEEVDDEDADLVEEGEEESEEEDEDEEWEEDEDEDEDWDDDEEEEEEEEDDDWD